MSEQLTKYDPKMPADADLFRIAESMAKSGYFKDASDVAKAMVKILAGRELGFGPFTSMANIVIVQGKATLSANLIAACVKGSRKYNFHPIEHSDTACELEFYEEGKPVGRSRFTIEDARKAGLLGKDVWKNYPRNMLFARAISNGAKWYCADAFMTGIYTPDELGNDDAEIVEREELYSAGMDRTPDEIRGTLPPQSTPDAPNPHTPPTDTATGGNATQSERTAATDGDKKITPAQVERFCTIAAAHGWTEDEQHRLIAKWYASRKAILRRDYDRLCEMLQDSAIHERVKAALFKEKLDLEPIERTIGEEDLQEVTT